MLRTKRTKVEAIHKIECQHEDVKYLVDILSSKTNNYFLPTVEPFVTTLFYRQSYLNIKLKVKLIINLKNAKIQISYFY